MVGPYRDGHLTFKSLLDIERLFGTCLKVWNVSLGAAEGHGTFSGDHTLVLFHVDFVSEHNLVSRKLAFEKRLEKRLRSTYKREVLRVPWAGLHKKLISPAVEGVEAFGVVDVVDQYTAIRSSVEGDAQRLKALLPRGVPQLRLPSA